MHRFASASTSRPPGRSPLRLRSHKSGWINGSQKGRFLSSQPETYRRFTAARPGAAQNFSSGSESAMIPSRCAICTYVGDEALRNAPSKLPEHLRASGKRLAEDLEVFVIHLHCLSTFPSNQKRARKHEPPAFPWPTYYQWCSSSKDEPKQKVD
jgi:hypothetical protein